MARIAGLELQDKLRIDYALTQIKGIGWPLSKRILASVNIQPNKRISQLSAEDVSKINAEVEEYPTGSELVRQIKTNITRLKQISSYRGLRHSHNLPVRGQRTRTNARTKRGKRRTVGAYKKEMLSKITQQKT